MIFFTRNVLYTIGDYDGDGWKKNLEQKKNLFDYPPIPNNYNMEADCFLISEGTKNKPDLP